MSETEQDGRQMVVTMPAEREIRVEREFPAPRARVFAAFTDAEQIPKWWGPRGYETIVDQFEPRTGGVWRFVHRGEGGEEHGFRGVFREVTEPERIVQTFEWEGMPGYPCLETVEFEELDGGRTRIVSTSVFFSDDERDGMYSSGMEKGAIETYERLEELLVG